jgi:aerobic-type carbon monoxide dehydrogenase small subunit (CoxS/CutS family)
VNITLTINGSPHTVDVEPDQEIDAAMAGILCRCGTYLRIKQGIRRAATLMRK